MGNVAIFSGNDAKLLKTNINLFDSVKILSGSADPTSSAQSAPKGSIYMSTSTGLIYRKTDAGSSTNWVSLTDAGYNSSLALSNLGLATSVASSALTIALKDGAGSDPSAGSPVSVGFRHATATTGQFTTVSTTAALSLVVPSGATLGQRDAIESDIYIYLINNSGTAELCVSRSYIWDEGITVTTTTIGTGSDSASVFYSTTGRANVPIRLIGKLINTQATAGTWASAGTQLCVMPFTVSAISGKMYKTSSQNPGTTALTTTTWESVASAEGGFDPFSICDLTNDRLVASQPGIWDVTINLSLANFDASAQLFVFLRKGGTSIKRWDVLSVNGNTRDWSVTFPIYLAYADYLEIATQSSADSSYSISGVAGLADTTSYFAMSLRK